MGSLLPEPGKNPVYAQLYIVSPSTALEQHLANNAQHANGTGLRTAVMQTISDCLNRHNRWINVFKSAYERISDLEQQNPDAIQAASVKLHFKDHSDPRRYNLPTAEEVAVILPGPGQAADYQDIILQTRAGTLQRIYETNPAYQPLHYVLLFPRGELGWHPKIPYANADQDNNNFGNKHVTQMEYYAYCLYKCLEDSDHIFRAGILLQQFIVDGWAQTD
jgi:hypothetical protein